MSDFISREAAIKLFNFAVLDCLGMEPTIRAGDIIKALESIPAADVREVVLCRDCVNYVESDEANGEKMCVIDAEWCEEDGCYYGFTAYTEPDWFCAGGIKREES